MQSTHRRRLQEIVDVVFDGNETAAAEAAGVLQSTLHRILSGDIANPRVTTLQKLADAFGQPIGWFTGEIDKLPTEEIQKIGPQIGPRWFHLLWNYHNRATQAERDWLEKAIAGTPEQQALQDRWRDFVETNAAKELWIDSLPAWAHVRKPYPKGPPTSHELRTYREEYLPVFRDILKAEASLIRLVSRQLKRLGAKTGS